MDFAYIHNDKLSGLVKEDAQTLQQGRSDKRLHWVDFAFMAEMEAIHLVHMNIGYEHLSSVGYAPDASLMFSLHNGYQRVQIGNADQHSGILPSDPFYPLVGTAVSGYVDVGTDDFALKQDQKLVMSDLGFGDDLTNKPIICEQITELQDKLCGAKYAACWCVLQIKGFSCQKNQSGYEQQIDVPDTYGWLYDWSPVGAEGSGGSGYTSELTGVQEIESIEYGDISNGNIPKGIDSATLYFSVHLTERKEIYKESNVEESPGEWEVVIDYSKSVLCSIPVQIDAQTGRYKVDLQAYRGQINFAMQKAGMAKQNLPGPEKTLWYQKVETGKHGSIDGIIVFRYDQDHIFNRA